MGSRASLRAGITWSEKTLSGLETGPGLCAVTENRDADRDTRAILCQGYSNTVCRSNKSWHHSPALGVFFACSCMSVSPQTSLRNLLPWPSSWQPRSIRALGSWGPRMTSVNLNLDSAGGPHSYPLISWLLELVRAPTCEELSPWIKSGKEGPQSAGSSRKAQGQPGSPTMKSSCCCSPGEKGGKASDS